MLVMWVNLSPQLRHLGIAPPRYKSSTITLLHSSHWYKVFFITLQRLVSTKHTDYCNKVDLLDDNELEGYKLVVGNKVLDNEGDYSTYAPVVAPLKPLFSPTIVFLPLLVLPYRFIYSI